MPEYRADHVGSFLRPPELLEATAAYQRGDLSQDALRATTDRAVLQILEEQRAVGVDVFSDGEYRRSAWLSGPLESFEGFVDAGEAARTAPQNQMRWRGAANEIVPMEVDRNLESRRLPVIGGKLRARRRLNGDEVPFLKDHAPGPFKVTNPGPTWFLRHSAPGISDQVYRLREEALDDLVGIMREEVQSLVADGVPYVQIDSIRYVFDYTDPKRRQEWKRWGVDPDHAIAQDVRADNALLEGVRREGVTFGLHMCRGNFFSRWYAEGGYGRIAEAVFPALDYDRLLLEFDTERAGGFEPLRFVPEGKVVVLGLVSTKDPRLETVDELRRRIEEASRYVPIENLALSGQCGFASVNVGNELTWDDQRRKLERIVETAHRVWGQRERERIADD